ncbi:hypothetical protein BGZ54_008534 [Gamsiella multidivaricata]|nr:hypothetical protein BGZ54_008534 [Gamsiella multidivaricata]
MDRGAIKDSFKSKSTSIPKPLNEHVGPYLLGRTLGKGSSGCVKLAHHRRTKEQVAVKIISKASLINRAAVHRGIEREIAIMKLINHPHVIRLYDVYETDKELFLVMEYVSGGELFEYLVNKGRLGELEALQFFQQIIVGLAFCHKRKICHRDLKPENLLLDDQMNVKIADFGMASLQKTGRLLETSCGSPHYASPEVVTGLKYDGSASDIWSCGIILYALLTGHLPFDDENIRQLLGKVKIGKFYMPTDISIGARDLISRMLTVNPKRRITMQGVMMHPWFRTVNPERNTLREPVQSPESVRTILAEELDAEILRHMRWLFAPGPSHSDPEAKEVFDEEALLYEIQEKMTNKEENMEKQFYHLLYQHKTELLEDYTGEETDTVPDAPRRRADSFPTSTAYSIRSATPEFGRTAHSPRDSPIISPASALSPIVKETDPTPLILDPELPSVTSSSACPGGNSLKQSQSPTGLKEANPLKDPTSAPKQRSLNPKARTKSSFETIQRTKSIKKDESGLDEDIVKEEPNRTSLPKATPTSGSSQESHMHGSVNKPHQAAAAVSGQQRSLTILSPMAAQLPPLHSMEAANTTDAALSMAEDEKMEIDAAADTTSPSIENQVLSTQISEISQSFDSTHSVVAPPQDNINGGVAISPAAHSVKISKTAASSSRGPKPMLHPLSDKASSGTTAPLTIKSNVSALEAQERVEIILKYLFQSSIQIERYKKPALGVKCRFEGGVINDRLVKAVKFKVDISEKTVSTPPPSSSGSASNSSSRTASSSAVAAILVAVNHHKISSTSGGNRAAVPITPLPPQPPTFKKTPKILAGRRASDGGSILSSAAAAVSSHFAAARASKKPSHTHFRSNNTSSSAGYRHSVHGVIPNVEGGPSHNLSQLRRVVKVTLHQQQGANSTLRMIYERLCAGWDLPLEQMETEEDNSPVASPMAAAPRATVL